jgi:hypothetical protein
VGHLFAKEGPINASGIFEWGKQSQSVRSNPTKRKHFSLEDSADERVGDDAVFSGQDSDDEYIPGAKLRAKCTTEIGRQESKSSKNEKGRATTTPIKYPLFQRPIISEAKLTPLKGQRLSSYLCEECNETQVSRGVWRLSCAQCRGFILWQDPIRTRSQGRRQDPTGRRDPVAMSTGYVSHQDITRRE